MSGSTDRGNVDVLVVAPLPEEMRPLLDHLEQSQNIAGFEHGALGRMFGARIAAVQTGDGASTAGAVLSQALAAVRPRVVFAIGIAGGLSDDLALCDVVIANRVQRWTDALGFQSVEAQPRLTSAPGGTQGVVVSADRILWTSEQKTKVGSTLESSPAVVDIESATYVEVCSRQNVECVVIRSVSDEISDSLPFDLNRCVGPDGGIRRGAVVRYALTHPWVIPRLRELQKKTDAACAALCTHTLAAIGWWLEANPAR